MINNATGGVQAQAQVTIQPGPWKRYEYKLTTGANFIVHRQPS